MATTPTLMARLRRLLGRPEDETRLRSTVSAAQAVDLVRDGAALVDVRERHEWKAGHAPQAIHLPLADLADKAAQRLPRDRPVVVVCASGMRSRTGAKQLRSLGFDATSLAGGMPAWQGAGGAARR